MIVRKENLDEELLLLVLVLVLDERSAMPAGELLRDVSQKGGQLGMNPFRNGRPPEGDTEHLTILLDTVVHGKLPEHYQPVDTPSRHNQETGRHP
jgi:hypothetical protein